MITPEAKPGLYIHIPFCRSKCGYCDFYSVTSSGSINRYIRALKNELKLSAATNKTADAFSTIYIGGGTPSVLHPADMATILSVLRENFKFTKTCETTIEVNPGTIDENVWRAYLKMGINRINIGVQSFIDHELIILNRIHNAEKAEKTYRTARKAGFANIGIDLIYGIPGQLLADWKYNLEKCTGLHPEHISVYNLTIEPGTSFADAVRSGQLQSPGEETEITFYLVAEQTLQDAGYLHYEVSNYARSAVFISQHNYKYWNHAPYLGFGPSAHSFWNGKRWSNHRSVNQYCLDLKNNRLPIAYQEQLGRAEIMLEHIYLSLRTCRGLNLNQFKELFKCNFLLKYRKIIKKLKQNRLIVVDNDYIRFTIRGILISDEILSYFANY
jgi:oxygen-independent coproporphyrinogen-3 oxidase